MHDGTTVLAAIDLLSSTDRQADAIVTEEGCFGTTV